MIKYEVGQIYQSEDDTVTITYVTTDYGNTYVRFTSEKFGKQFECDSVMFAKSFPTKVSLDVVEDTEVNEPELVEPTEPEAAVV